MDLNDTINDFQETKVKRVRNVSYPKNKLPRNKRQKTTSEVEQKGSQKEKNNSQNSSKNEDNCIKNEDVVESTSSYFSNKKSLPFIKSSISSDVHLDTDNSSDSVITLSESLKNKPEFSNLSVKTESSIQAATDCMTPAINDCPQNVVPSVLQQDVQGSVQTTKETSEEEWWCIFCSSTFPSENKDAHIKSCVLQFEYKTSAGKESGLKEEDKPPCLPCELPLHCEVCKTDITHLSLQDRNTHVNSCIDQQTADSKLPVTSHDPLPETRTETINISECPVCGKQFTSLEARLIHIKKCCKKHKMEPQQVIGALQLQEKHALERIALGLPPLQIKPSTVKTNVNPRQRKRKTPLQVQVKSDPDLQIAMALSLSLKEEEKRKQEALGLLLGNSGNLVFDAQTDDSNKPSGILNPPSHNQMPGRTKPRNKKNDPNKPVPTLLLRTEEERLKLLQERVSAIITPGSPKRTLPVTPAMVDPEIPQPNSDVAPTEFKENSCDPEKATKLCELWTLSGLAPEKDAYYVPELHDWVLHSEVVAGSKLKNLSQIPGHKISHDFSFEYSTFYTQDHQGIPLSQNCSAKQLVDIPSTQEMLDVITGNEASASKVSWDAYQNLESVPVGYGNFGGEVKNDGFFPDMKKNMNPNTSIPVIDCLHKLVGNPWMSDVTIIVTEQRSVPAHKLLLIPRCPTIEKELQEQHNGISLLDWSCTSLKAALEFLHFLYTGFCQLDGPFRKEVSALFYRYNMAEAYEALKNDSRLTDEEGSCAGDDVSSECDIDAFQENQDNAESSDVVMNQDTVLEFHDIYGIHSRSGDLVTKRNSLNFSDVSSPENNSNPKSTFYCGTEKENANVSIKKKNSVTSPGSYHCKQHETSSNDDVKILREEKCNTTFLGSDNWSAFKKASVSQGAGQSSLKENHNFKNSRDLSPKVKNSSEANLSLISDEEIKYLCSPDKGQPFCSLEVSASDPNGYHPNQRNKFSLSGEEQIRSTEDCKHSFNDLGFPIKDKSLPSICGNNAILNISLLKHNISAIESKSCGFNQNEGQRHVSKNHNKKISANVGINERSNLLSGSDSEELFICDSDEEVSAVCSSNVNPCNSSTCSASSSQKKPSSYLPEMSSIISQKLIPKSPDNEIVIVNEVSNTNCNISASCVSMQTDFLSLRNEIDTNCQKNGSSKKIYNSPVKRTCISSDDESLPDLTAHKQQIRSSQTLLSTPTSSRSNSFVKQQKRKLSSSISPLLLGTTHTSGKKSKVGVEKFNSSDLSPLLNIENDHCAAGDNYASSYTNGITVYKNSGQSNTSTCKSDVLSNGNYSSTVTYQTCNDNIDGSDAELDEICASNRNKMHDMWEGFDDDGFKDKIGYQEHNINTNENFQLLTPLKSSRDRPPTPHPSSARKSSARKLSFVGEDVSPLSSPLRTGTDEIDLDSSPILMRPLAERLGAVNQKKVSHRMKTTEATEPCTTPKHKENKLSSKKEMYPASHDMRTSAISKTTVQNFTVSASPVTPLPNFKEMVTPELKDQLRKYGVRPLPRKKAVSLLTHIYDETHPWQSETDLDGASKNPVTQERLASQHIATSRIKLSPKKQVISPLKVKKSEKQKSAKSTKPVSKKGSKSTDNSKVSNMKNGQQINYEEEEPNISSSQTSSLSESSDFPEESILRSEEYSDDELITPSQNESVEQRISNYIMSGEDLYAKMLMYEPVNLLDLKQQLKQQGIKVGCSKLMDFMDEKCITFTLPRSEKHQKKQQARSQRFRKRMISKLSQKPSSQAS